MFERHRYRGRHRAPSTAGRTVARAAIIGAAGIAPVALAALPAQADTLDNIEQCESSGNPQASNGTHFGLYQFDLQTWRSVGGSGNPMGASRAEQRHRAELLMASRGTQPWDASRACWSKRGAGPSQGRAEASSVFVEVPPPPQLPVPAPQEATQAAPSGSYTVLPGDTLSAIAAAHGEAWQALWRANAATVADPDLIYPGERLTLA